MQEEAGTKDSIQQSTEVKKELSLSHSVLIFGEEEVQELRNTEMPL